MIKQFLPGKYQLNNNSSIFLVFSFYFCILFLQSIVTFVTLTYVNKPILPIELFEGEKEIKKNLRLTNFIFGWFVGFHNNSVYT